MSDTSTVKQLQFLAIAEGISYLSFALTMPLKYIYDIKWPNQVIGMAHGVLFIAYCVWVILVAKKVKWPAIRTMLALGASLLPFATFFVDIHWLRPLKTRQDH